MSHKILIIGAGASGLRAASILGREKHEVTVIEARDRIGGRIHTAQSNLCLPVEMGAEFMHGKQPETLSLIHESKIKVSLLGGNRYPTRCTTLLLPSQTRRYPPGGASCRIEHPC